MTVVASVAQYRWSRVWALNGTFASWCECARLSDTDNTIYVLELRAGACPQRPISNFTRVRVHPTHAQTTSLRFLFTSQTQGKFTLVMSTSWYNLKRKKGIVTVQSERRVIRWARADTHTHTHSRWRCAAPKKKYITGKNRYFTQSYRWIPAFNQLKLSLETRVLVCCYLFIFSVDFCVCVCVCFKLCCYTTTIPLISLCCSNS